MEKMNRMILQVNTQMLQMFFDGAQGFRNPLERSLTCAELSTWYATILSVYISPSFRQTFKHSGPSAVCLWTNQKTGRTFCAQTRPKCSNLDWMRIGNHYVWWRPYKYGNLCSLCCWSKVTSVMEAHSGKCQRVYLWTQTQVVLPKIG